ncbi:carboxypeptidase-like regulatory domain-containing protein [Natrononativus amylolyticus]|uniref:carboxypeptidase-like regulatory domain-containing protein n=1 Tax=Natrononativus amylolyticus TaxID=2963434 RepID=UPI0020CD6C18|nr:carboxypeptidase-like regulatory domain-containing protein [Natrononativus amylolyticus]
MYIRNGVTDERLTWLFNGIHAGLVLFGVLLFGIGITFSLATSGVIDPGMPSIGDDTDDDGADLEDDAGGDDGVDEDDASEEEEDETDEDDGGGGEDADGESDDSEGDAPDDGDEADDATDDGADDSDDGADVSEPDTSLLELTVVDPVGNPIENVSVSGEGEPHEADIPLEFSGETDANGQYTDEIYENEYEIELDHPDYEAETIEHDHDGAHELTVELESDGAPEAALMTLTVVDSDGEPIEGASVSGEGEPLDADVPLEFSGETDDDGQYTDVIYENEYTIEIDHPDYESLTGSYTHDGEQEVVAELEEE